MSSARHGITNHELVVSFERFHKRLLRLGFSDQKATRGALALTFAQSGKLSREQIWQDTNEIGAQLQRLTVKTGLTEL